VDITAASSDKKGMSKTKERKLKREIYDFINWLDYRSKISSGQKLALKQLIRDYRKESIQNAIDKI